MGREGAWEARNKYMDEQYDLTNQKHNTMDKPNMKIFVGIDTNSGEMTDQEAREGALALAQALENEFNVSQKNKEKVLSKMDSFHRKCPKCSSLMNVMEVDSELFPVEQVVELKAWCQACKKHTLCRVLSLRDFDIQRA